MASAVALIFTVLSTLPLLSRGYAIDYSCDTMGPDVVQGVTLAMADGKKMADLAKPAATKRPDRMDDTRSRMFSAPDRATDKTQLAQAKGQYKRVLERVPWELVDQSPPDTDYLYSDRLTLYCGDDMLVPDEHEYQWRDERTNYVFWGPEHKGDPDARFCEPGKLMYTLTHRGVIYPPQQDDDDTAVVIICNTVWVPMPEDGIGRGHAMAYDVQQALEPVPNVDTGELEPRFTLGAHMTDICELIISPSLFHEMFHVGLNSLGMLPQLDTEGKEITEVYTFENCDGLPFETAVWNPETFMLYGLSLLFKFVNPDFMFTEGYLGSRSAAVPSQQIELPLRPPPGGPGPIWGQG